MTNATRHAGGRTLLVLLAALVLVLSTVSALKESDILYVGKRQAGPPRRDDVVAINLVTKQLIGDSFASHPPNTAPRGLFFQGGSLNVAFQNAGTPNDGEVLQFNKSTGVFERFLVDHTAPSNPPWAPRGAIWIPGNLLVVADMGELCDPAHLGFVRIYNYSTGEFLRKFSAELDVFRPRGVVYLKGKLYVTSFVNELPGCAGEEGLPNLGYISRFDPLTGFEEVIADHTTCSDLHRPEGIVVGPDGNLWVTSFRYPDTLESTDVDKILVFNSESETGECIESKTIPLWEIGHNRVFTQALVFGSNGDLYISAIIPQQPGQVKKYNFRTRVFEIVFQGSTGFQPWYLAFKKTDPSSLAYRSN